MPLLRQGFYTSGVSLLRRKNTKMQFKTINVDFGSNKKIISVPETSTIVEFKEPEFLANSENELEKALAQPCGSPPFEELIKPGMSIAIGFDDPTRPPAPWQLILPNIITKLISKGIKKEDIVLICANGTHKKWTPSELKNFVGDEIFQEFWGSGQLINHDCVEKNGLKALGKTRSGCLVEHNRRFLESDLMIYVGQVMAHTWGGYTGTGAVIGLASAKSIMSHHDHSVVNHPETALGDHKRMYFRKLKAEINEKIEKETGKRIFYVNWVGGTAGRMAGIFAGYSPEIEEPAWTKADEFSIYNVPQADIFIIGLAESFAYGSANNPMIAAIGMAYPTRVWLGDHLLRKGGVVIGVSSSNGKIDHDTYPSYQELLELADKHENIHELRKYEKSILSRPDLLKKYQDGHAFHPLHPFWLLYSCDYMFSRASKVLIVGTKDPRQFTKLGMQACNEFDDAWKTATEIVGNNPVTVVAPSYWSRRIFKFNVN